MFEPKFIFANEPTGNLDPKSAQEVAELLITCCKEHGAGLIMVTHSERLARRAEHIFALADGQLHAVNMTQLTEANTEASTC